MKGHRKLPYAFTEHGKAKAKENTFKPILETASKITTFTTNNVPVKVAPDQIISHVEDKIHESLGGDDNTGIIRESPRWPMSVVERKNLKTFKKL